MKGRTSRLTDKRIWLSAMGVLVVVGAFAVITLVRPITKTRADSVDCSGAWYNSPDPVVLDTCSKQKAANRLLPADEMATITAQPYVRTDPNFVLQTPQPMLPMPDYAKQVEEMKFGGDAGAPPSGWRGFTSAWVDGGVPDTGYTYWSKLYVLARSGYQNPRDIGPEAVPTRINGESYPRLNTDILDGGGPGMGKYLKEWTCPQPIGDIVITNITNPPVNITDVRTPYPGLQSVVYFKAKESGQTGKFDMATETWTFDPATKSP